MTWILSLITGMGLGYIIERGDWCFHSTLRGIFRRPPHLDLLRAYLLAILIAAPLVRGLMALGLIEPWIPPFTWLANIVGGIIFGVGMVIASSCITGLFYKLGHGMLGALIGLAGWAVGDIVTYRGPLNPIRQALQVPQITLNGQGNTLLDLPGGAGLLLSGVMGILGAVWLWRAPRSPRAPHWPWPRLGLAVGLFTSLAWLLARVGGSNYTFGTSGVPAGALTALLEDGGGGSLWIPLALVGLVPGSFLAAARAGTLWIRGESMWRYVQLAAGGLLMGIGAGIAGGCNLGHSLVGVPLLAMGSITSTAAMALGVFLAHHIATRWAERRVEPLPAESVG